MPFLSFAFVLPLAAGAGLLLAWLARESGRPWTVTGALLLGHDAGHEDLLPNQPPGIDLRFVCFALAVLVMLVTAAALPGPFRTLAPGALAFVLLLSLPLVAGCLALLADGLLALKRWHHERDTAEREALLEAARAEVLRAQDRVEDPDRLTTLEALSEVLDEPDGEMKLDDRIRAVVALARSCAVEDGRHAARLLGVSADASQEEVRGIYEALTRLYQGSESLPGTDPTKAKELGQAYERLRRAA